MLSRNLTLSAFFRVAILAYKIRGVRLQTSISILKGTRKREFANKHNDTRIEDVDLIDQPGATFSMILKVNISLQMTVT